MDRQLSIPGLEGLKKAKANADEKHKIFLEQLQALQDRILRLELEVLRLRDKLMETKPMSFVERQIETILEEKRRRSGDENTVEREG